MKLDSLRRHQARSSGPCDSTRSRASHTPIEQNVSSATAQVHHVCQRDEIRKETCLSIFSQHTSHLAPKCRVASSPWYSWVAQPWQCSSACGMQQNTILHGHACDPQAASQMGGVNHCITRAVLRWCTLIKPREQRVRSARAKAAAALTMSSALLEKLRGNNIVRVMVVTVTAARCREVRLHPAPTA